MAFPNPKDLELGENDSSGNGIMADRHQVIDLTYPNSRFVLSFINLSYSVKVGPKMKFPVPICRKAKVETTQIKMLLDNISGEAREGEILAVLGASGSGKSTLIDALAGRIEKESLKGAITLNGEALESRLLKIISAYVMQDDLLFPMLTVEETLMVSAEFRLPRSVSKQKKQARVQTLIDQLGLQSAAKTVIGDEGHRGVSGGERRRVSIGINLIHSPILLFLDEPTSGLDSTSAFMVVNVLRRIARSGSIVIMSIHQPSYRLVNLLDHLIFLSNGQTVYSGQPTNLVQFFKVFGHPVPENENPTEFALDLIQELKENPGGITKFVEFNKSWHHDPIDQNPISHVISLEDAIKASISRGKLVAADVSNLATAVVPTFANPFWIEMIVIAKRRLTTLCRIPELLGIRFAIILATGLLLANLFWHVEDSQGSQGRIGFFMFIIVFILCICLEEAPTFLQEKYIFIRETSYNSYRRASYVLTHTLVSIPFLIILALVLSTTTFWSVGLAGGLPGFFFFFITIFASFWVGSSFITFVTGIVSDLILALTVAGAILSYFFLFSGFFISRNNIPPYLRWLHYMSVVKYLYQGLLQNEYNGPAKCFSKGMQLFEDTPLDDLPEPAKNKLLETVSNALGTNITSSSCAITGMKILEQKGATDINKWNCFWIAIAFGILFRVLFYLSLLFGSKNKRK
ncbi:hypothetical protein Ddye_015133 [Dipteronia dyeriana]|uniref:ABC transporter domain-containing protein n=1 Tax=Dipteronia dyeriana TaxID=168575 RepID=A0AAD9U5D0_9ROSI|nr:hypothetical protein Ddye_015133 [Dipteronia dyeriana]